VAPLDLGVSDHVAPPDVLSSGERTQTRFGLGHDFDTLDSGVVELMTIPSRRLVCGMPYRGTQTMAPTIPSRGRKTAHTSVYIWREGYRFREGRARADLARYCREETTGSMIAKSQADWQIWESITRKCQLVQNAKHKCKTVG